MPIEVENHLWVAVRASSFALQFDRAFQERGAQCAAENSDAYMEEAEARADHALEVYRKAHGLEPMKGSSPS
jgi:Leu/Phe-tRNA-protein transferase